MVIRVATFAQTPMASALAMKGRTFPGNPMGLKPDRVELFDQVEEL